MKRLFAAVKVNPEIPLSDMLLQMQKDMAFHRINWVRPENIHITLKFFGETGEDVIPKISAILAESATKVSPFTMQLSGTGIFGSRYNPKVIWAGLNQAESLVELASAINEGLKTIGILPDRQNFVPHITMGRIKQVADLKLFQKTMEKYKGVKLHECQINKLILFESILKREGPEYIQIHNFILNNKV